MKCNSKAFSLIELLVVIAVIGVLAAIAVPAYNNYQLKTKVTKSLTLVDAIARDALNYYSRKGVFPTSIVVNNVTVPNSSWTDVNYGAIRGLAYEVNSNSFMINATLTGLEGVPGYVAPVSATPTAHSILTYVVRDVGNGVVKTVCGQYNAATITNAVPVDYLPGNCTCAEGNIFFVSGTGC